MASIKQEDIPQRYLLIVSVGILPPLADFCFSLRREHSSKQPAIPHALGKGDPSLFQPYSEACHKAKQSQAETLYKAMQICKTATTNQTAL